MVVGRANQFLAMRPRMGILLAGAWGHCGHAAATRYKKGVAVRTWTLLHFRIVGVVFHFYEATRLRFPLGSLWHETLHDARLLSAVEAASTYPQTTLHQVSFRPRADLSRHRNKRNCSARVDLLRIEDPCLSAN